MSKRVKPLNSLNKLEAEKQSKILAQEQAEKIDAMGQENEVKAAKWVIEQGEVDRHEEDEKQAVAQWKLDDAKGKILTYQETIWKEAVRQMAEYDIPKGFQWNVFLNEKGLLFGFRSPDGKLYRKGMKISTFPKEDLQGITNMLFKALDHMEELEEQSRDSLTGLKKSPGGILL